jgi:hypothetical protein
VDNLNSHLSPYQHELNGSGTDCAHDCPACRWVSEQAIEKLRSLAETEINCECTETVVCISCRADIYCQRRWLENHVADIPATSY